MPEPEITRNPPVDDALCREMARLWARVTNAGGAVGFVGPVEPDDIEPTARAELDRVADGLDDLVVAREGGRLVAFGFLATSSAPVTRHVGTLKRLQRDPEVGGRGLGAVVLAEVERAAWERGLEVIALTARTGTGREGFYLAAGYRLDAELPDRLKVDGELRGELHLSKRRPDLVAQGAVGEAASEGVASSRDGEAPAGQGASPALLVRRLDPAVPLPVYAHPGDAGLDLVAAEDVTLAPGQRALVPTGLAVAVPSGHVGLVHPRSGLAVRHGVGIVNAPGTVDAGYRGEVKVLLVNHDPADEVRLARGERIAQLVVQPVAEVDVVEVEILPDSARGQGGFGSTGR